MDVVYALQTQIRLLAGWSNVSEYCELFFGYDRIVLEISTFSIPGLPELNVSQELLSEAVVCFSGSSASMDGLESDESCSDIINNMDVEEIRELGSAQRSGHLPYNQRVKWRGHSGLTDGLDQGVDLVGGYYDAGDHVKFGLPMAFTVTLLSWSVIEYEKDIKVIDEFEHALEAIKWGTDYFVKAHTHPCVLWVQVGDGSSDHYCWQRPEDMTTPRRSFKIDKNSPGSEVAAETAVALASASIAFKKSNSQYSSFITASCSTVI